MLVAGNGFEAAAFVEFHRGIGLLHAQLQRQSGLSGPFLNDLHHGEAVTLALPSGLDQNHVESQGIAVRREMETANRYIIAQQYLKFAGRKRGSETLALE